MARAAGALALAALLGCAGCRNDIASKAVHAQAKPGQHLASACDHRANGGQLKAAAFEQARSVRSGTAPALDRLLAGTDASIDRPAETSRDDALRVTICSGRLVLALPPGSGDAFNGNRRLSAEVRYAVQEGTGSQERVYAVGGVEPIAYRLAALDLKAASTVSAPPPSPLPSMTPAGAPVRTAAMRRALRSPLPVREVADRSWAREPRLTTRGRPSFACRGLRSRAQMLVCRDERLAALDRVESSLYRRAVRYTGGEAEEALRWTHGRFLARRDGCANAACVAQVYRSRMDEIDRIAAEE